MLEAHPGYGVQRPRPSDDIIAGPARTRDSAVAAGLASAVAQHQEDPWWQRRAVLRERLTQAAGWKAWLDGGSGRSQADLARRERVSRARVCQVIRLVDLDPEIMRDLDVPGSPVPTERTLFALASLKEPGAQVARYREMVVEALSENAQRCAGAPIPKPRIRGDVRHLLERARRYQALLDSGACRSLIAIAEQEGLTPTRVGQVLLLLHLHPEILALLDQPGERAPLIRYHDLLRVARIRDQRKQVQAFYGLIVGQVVEAK